MTDKDMRDLQTNLARMGILDRMREEKDKTKMAEDLLAATAPEGGYVGRGGVGVIIGDLDKSWPIFLEKSHNKSVKTYPVSVHVRHKGTSPGQEQNLTVNM